MEHSKMYELCERDYFMNAEHAKELGFIDDIIGKKPEKTMDKFSGSVKH
jgi:ATP-dependent protease ClpP protease subunit